jgi:hypothetical protein
MIEATALDTFQAHAKKLNNDNAGPSYFTVKLVKAERGGGRPDQRRSVEAKGFLWLEFTATEE